MQFETEFISLAIFKQRQQELIKEAQEQRMINERRETLRREKTNTRHPEDKKR